MKTNFQKHLVDEEGENIALRMFLAIYGGNRGVTTKMMRNALRMSGYDGAWPDWANKDIHLTKAGAQLWIKHLIDLEDNHNDDERQKEAIDQSAVP